MRTTVTLDQDVAAKLKAEARRSGKSFKETKRGYPPWACCARTAYGASSFQVRAHSLGELRPGLNLDNVSELINA